MVNRSRLMALLEIDDQGEQIASLLNQALIDDRKRHVLLARLRELQDDMRVVEQDIVLTQSEREVLAIVQDAMKPTTTAEVQSLAKGRSLREYRQHTSAALNALVGKGLLGKVSLAGRQVYFAPARDAVRHALTQLGQTPDEFDPQRIASVTGLRLGVVLEIVEGM